VSTFDRVADLPLVVEGYELERLEQPISPEFTRVTTLVRLRGDGEEGIGEDVTYSGESHDRLHAAERHNLGGDWTLASLSEQLDGLELFPEPPEMAAFRDYRRWAFESAALDLALRQAGRSLADALGRDARPVRFVVSLRLGEPSSVDPLRLLLDGYPGTRFKLDPVSDWTPELISEIAALEATDVVDLKGQYTGTVVDNPADPVLYRRVAEAFPSAWIEDPALTEETDAVLGPHRDRITWDAPIHSVADIEALPFPPRTINIKPSRFGSLARLFETYDYCGERGIGMYGGGQFELGVGRGQIQYLASLFHPDSSNDVAPGGYNRSPIAAGLAESPLPPASAPTGFRWG
jgi:L-alanine-DL-glutamate epimerase-like enolase superfamily enzyme